MTAGAGEAAFPLAVSVSPARPPGAGRAPVQRLLVFKLDHIGDMLVAAPALDLLRRSFSTAHITLVCGPWNVGLARRLGVADTVVASGVFAENAAVATPAERAAARRAALAELQAMALGRFDLAVDLRRDDDVREVLKLVDAERRAGFGDLATFGYLDLAAPMGRTGLHAGASRLSLGPGDFDSGLGHRRGPHGLHLSVREAEVELEVSTDAVWPPSDEGQLDSRLLGAALHRVDVRRTGPDGALGAPLALGGAQLAFGAGWLEGEPWGRWATVAEARVTLRFPAERPQVEVLAYVQGHTGTSHPRASVRISCGQGCAERGYQDNEGAALLAVPATARLFAPRAASTPHLLRPGRFAGRLRLHLERVEDWRPMTLTVRDGRGVQTVARLVLPEAVEAAGELDFPFAFEHRDAAEPLVFELSLHAIAEGDGPALAGLELDCLQARAPVPPLVHMEDQLLELATLVAVRHAPSVAADAEATLRRLAEPRAGSSAERAVAQVRARRGGRRLFGLVPARRVIGLGLGANKETKLWPRPYLLDLCRRLLGRREVDIALLGGPAEAAQAAGLRAELDAGGRVLDLCAACRIEDLGELLVELDGYIGLDTGVTHFAGRMGVAAFCLFGAAHDPAEWGPVGARSAWAAVQPPCAGCSKSLAAECAFDLRCMTELTPAQVWPLIERHLLSPA